MEARDFLLALVMIASSSVLTYKWIGRYGESDPVIVLAAVLLTASLAALLLSVMMRLGAIEEKIDSKERGLRISIQSIEESINARMDAIAQSTNKVMNELYKRVYR
ncbi:MAG TPA: hypothetical protein HA257_02380 [Candidatus Methanoperedenaceae archaeon]|nr:hypothetical protein [Candidatus Methanoperedenaceae archaeon]